MARWTIERGRVLCHDGHPIFALDRYNVGGVLTYHTSPERANELAARIAEALNERETPND